MRRAFQKYDDNNSGQLDAAELRAALQDLGLRHNTAEAARVLREYDGGGDGLLSLAEFIRLVRTLADGLPDAIPGDVRRAFHRIDENKSGQLDYRELRAALKELGLRSDTGEAVRLLQEYDRSGDGLLSLHEFGGLVRQLYLPDISPISQLYLPYFSTSSPLYLPYISPISPLYLPY